MNPIVNEIKKLYAIAREIYLSEKECIDHTVALVLYMIPVVVLTGLSIQLKLSSTIVIATMFITTTCGVLAGFTIPRSGTFVQRFFRRGKLVDWYLFGY